MKRLFCTVLCAAAWFGAAAQQVWTPDNGDGTFTNPIMWGDWPDPDIIRVGDDFYMVSTSMHYVPGCPIATSKDLVNWRMAGYAVERYDDDPRYDMQGGTLYLNGSWASTIRYRDGKFYVGFCTPYGWGTETGHFSICIADKPEGPWERALHHRAELRREVGQGRGGGDMEPPFSGQRHLRRRFRHGGLAHVQDRR